MALKDFVRRDKCIVFARNCKFVSLIQCNMQYLACTVCIMYQSGLSSREKHGGPVFSAVSGPLEDLKTVPESLNHLGP